MFGAARRDKAFKDYCLILQVHPEADAAMVDAAYWHLAKRYNEAAAFDSQAKMRLEELNEAYIVLGSAEKREEYMKLRAQMLGEGALPQAPRQAPSTPPLSVMSRQRPRERALIEATASPHPELAVGRLVLGALVLLGLTGVTLAAIASPIIAMAVMALGLAAILALGAIVASFGRVRARRKANPTGSTRDIPPLDKIIVQAQQVRRQAQEPIAESAEPAKSGDALDEINLTNPTETVDPAVLPDTASALSREAAKDTQRPRGDAPSDDPAKHRGLDQITEIKRQAAQLRRIADAHGRSEANPVQGDATPNADPEELAKIMRQTERLKAIAAKFNAARGQTSSGPSQEESQASSDHE